MIPIQLLLAPLEALLSSVGTGSMPFNGPSTQLRNTSDALTGVHNQSVRATLELDQEWQGRSADSTMTVMNTAHRRTASLDDRGIDIADVTDRATAIIESGYQDLVRIVDSFITTTAAAPVLFTPAGWAVLVQVAQEHLERGVQVIERVRGELRIETGSLQKIAAQQAADNNEQARSEQALAQAQKELVELGKTSPGSALSDAGAAVPDGGVQVTLPNGKVVTAPNEKAANAVRAALTQQGVPYTWGGTSPGEGLDCSGLTQYSYRQAGMEIPRLAQEQDIGTRIPESQAMAGDLVVWDGHVAMALGDGTLIEAGDPVAVSPMRTDNIGMGYQGVYRPTDSATVAV